MYLGTPGPAAPRRCAHPSMSALSAVLYRSHKHIGVEMKSVTTSINTAFATPGVALTARLCLIAVIAGAMLLLTPHFALAQQGGGGSGSNPFADSGARSTALDVLQSLRFWVWIAAGVGFCS